MDFINKYNRSRLVQFTALNRIVHMYGYESFEDRLAKRAEIAKDSEWQAYVTKARSLLTAQENSILIPTRFSPIKSLSDW